MAISVQQRTFFLGVVLCFFSSLFCLDNDQVVVEIPLLSGADSYSAQIEEVFGTPRIVEAFTITSDIAIQQDEICYLLGMQVGALVSADDIKRGCFYLEKKQKFQTITITVKPGVSGIVLDVFLEAFWTFAKVSVQGLLFGKDSYKQYYFLEQGELFDIKKHRDSCKKIEDVLHEKGYLDASVFDHLAYDRTVKTVTATLVIDCGSRFVIDDVRVVCKDRSLCDSDTLVFHDVQRKFIARLQGDYFSQELVNQETARIKKFLTKKGFMNATIQFQKGIDRYTKKLSLHFFVTLDKKKEFIFFGNHHFSYDELLEIVLAFGRSAWIIPMEIIAQDIEKQYHDAGFWDVSIECRNDGTRFYFMIQEGVRAKLGAIVLSGAAADHCVELEKLCSSYNKGFCELKMVNRVYDALGLWYAQHGFCDAQIAHHEYQQEDQATSNFVITVHEGQQYLVHDIEIKQFPELRFLGPFAAICPQTPHVFDARLLEQQRAWLIGYLRSHGYLYAKVVHELKHDGYAVKIIWHVTHCSEPVTFGKTVVRGVLPFPFKYVLANAQYRQQGLWNNECIEKTLLSFRDLGIFEAMQVVPDVPSHVVRERPVILNLVADDPFEVRLRAGFAQVSKNWGIKTGSTYKFGGSFAWKNPCSVADQFFFNGDATKFYRNIVAAYHRPWVFDVPLHLLAKGYAHKYIQPVYIGSDKPLYTALQHGFLLGIRRHVDALDAGCTVGFEVMKTTGLSAGLARAIDFTPELIDKGIPYFFVEPSLFFDMLDNGLNPSSGWYAALSCKGMFPLKEQSTLFFKLLAEYAGFFPVRMAVCAIRLRGGHIFKEKFSHVMPAERFYLGGENSLRSMYKDMAPPLGQYCTPSDCCLLVPQGGRSMANANIELRIPVVRDLGVVVFQDLGVLAQNSWSEVAGGKLLSATGFGLRYHTPVGPVRFDIGWRWKRQNPHESLYAWFLTIGHAF